MAFPLGDNLLALIFVSLADLTQDQRNTLTSIMTHRGRTLDQYNVQELRDLFLEMFCTTKTAVDNPMMQPSGIGQRRSFFVLEEGELEGTDGYSAEDDEDGAEGFLDALEDVFWVHNDADYTWYQRRFQGRQTRRGNGKGKRKGKGRGGRRFFKSRKGKGRGKRKKDRSHMVSEEGYEDEWNEGDKWNESHEGYRADDQNWNEGFWAYGDLYCTILMSMDISREKEKEKEKERKEGKARMMMAKEENQEMAKVSPVMFNLRPHRQLPYRTNSRNKLTILLQHQALVMVSLQWQRLNQHVDVLTATYAEQEEHRRTHRGGQNQRDAVAQQNRKEVKRFPVLVGDLDALRSGVQRRPAPFPREVGLIWIL